MSKDMHHGADYKYIPTTSVASGTGIEVLPDLYQFTIQIVNIQMVGDANKGFVLIDAGMPTSASTIMKAVEERFGKGSRPKAIILSHGHFDHVGGLIELIKEWNVPVYAHSLEMPYITGEKSYPTPDPTVEGGLIAKMSPFFPNEPVDIGKNGYSLPDDGTVPELTDFTWIHTPGHSPGHVSFFREKDRTLIAADAFVTVKQENLYDVMTQSKEISGPPRYLTTDWEAAKHSVEKLAELNPAVAVTGHGMPMKGDELSQKLNKLAEQFDEIAKPDYGRYVHK